MYRRHLGSNVSKPALLSGAREPYESALIPQASATPLLGPPTPPPLKRPPPTLTVPSCEAVAQADPSPPGMKRSALVSQRLMPLYTVRSYTCPWLGVGPRVGFG